MPPVPTAQQLDLALDLLRVLSPVQAIRDPALNRALAPFRGHPPTGLLCGDISCVRPFLWCALDPLTARVRFGARAPGDGAPAAAGRRTPPFDQWEPHAGAGESVALPGEPMLRWRFLCLRCRRPCVLTNARMITLIARALSGGRETIRPALE